LVTDEYARMPLEPMQKDLLAAMVEAERKLGPQRRQPFYLYLGYGGIP
jgi:hypothetical protein